jgi:hypothetical protein
MIVLVLVGVGTFKQEHANETAVVARFLRQSGVGMPDFVVEVDVVLMPRFSAASATHVVTVTASAVAVYVDMGAVTVSSVIVGTLSASHSQSTILFW